MTEVTWNLDDLRDEQGRYRTRSLFLETINADTPLETIFTLKPRDHRGKISLKRLYLELALPDSEYDFAITVFGEWEHWKKLCESNNWFKPYLKAWREELEIKTRSSAIRAMHQTAQFEGSKGTAAAKWIAEGKWKGQRGRPSKEEVARETRIQAGIEDDLETDRAIFQEYTGANKSH